MSGTLFGKKFKKKLLFVPNADTNPKVQHEISEPALFRFLLNEETIQELKEAHAEIPKMLNTLSGIDKLSNITEIETQQSSMGLAKDLGKAFHVFIVIKTTSTKDGDYWWSLEKNPKYIVLQRSRNKNDVKNKLNGKERKRVQPIAIDLKGKGTIKDLFSILWAYEVMLEKYHIVKSNCQSFVTLVSKTITEIGYEFKGYFKYNSPQENDRNVEMLDFINILSMSFKSKGHPLFHLIYYENPILFDKVMESGKYGINDTFTDHKITTLHLAIGIQAPEMVRHILGHPEVNPTKPDGKGRTAIHLAALYAQQSMEIVDLLLEHKKVEINERNLDYGWTALHWAVCACNSIAVQHLIDKGADPNIFDKDGLSPLHLAASKGNGTEIMDLILKAKKSKQNIEGIDDVDDEFGTTALHMAVIASNETTADYLIKRGSNINHRDKSGRTSLHLAAEFAQDMKIIDLLLKNIKKKDIKKFKKDENISKYAEKNEKGLGEEIIDRLRTKGICGKKKDPTFSGMEDESNKQYDVTVASNEKIEKKNETIIRRGKNEITYFETSHEAKRIVSNDRLKKKLSADTKDTYDTQIKIMLPLALRNIIIESDVEKVHILKNEGKDIRIATWKHGKNALHIAAKWAKTTELIDVIKKAGIFDINGVDNKGYTPLHYALLGNNLTIDHKAVCNKDIDLFDLFLKPEEVDIDGDKSGRPARLMNESNLTTTSYLLDKGANPNIIARKEWTPFLLAARYAKDIDIFRLFLVNKTVPIDVNHKQSNGRNALNFVSKYYKKENLIEIVRLLIEKNIDVNCQNNYGRNAYIPCVDITTKKI